MGQASRLSDNPNARQGEKWVALFTVRGFGFLFSLWRAQKKRGPLPDRAREYLEWDCPPD
jgi:hypothetical protein